ncbi:glycosyltransferase [Snuella sedimenti]|uniref:Glycosyltransferase n=1 Tax=Snuella sedimenti TaxID=2798802 RepID=A0A8J7IYS6_9FLAO|nr:glycosyltransferase [Snuella sedimenti]MBJ6369125.1 glycosyltransferase [Snuella sedimenti]
MGKRILVAPLHWGLGHATRCIPIIKALSDYGYTPILASDGNALSLLKKEFPKLIAIELPAYNITYPKNGKHFKLKILKTTPRLLKAINTEKQIIDRIVNTYHVKGIISDNRLGVYGRKVPSVFITHQLNVLSGYTTWFSTKIHLHFIKQFDACWVPDSKGDINLSGKLGHPKTYEIPTYHIGPLSRFETKNTPMVNDILVLLSGPEPQRSLLETILFKALNNYNGRVVFVKGIMEKEQTIETVGNMTIYNFMTSDLLEKTINESELVIARSGYTTIMDLAKLNKQAFFIPTPGQSEQEYLAKRLSDQGLVASCSQKSFTLDKIKHASSYKGLSTMEYKPDFKNLFSLFECK